MKKIYRYSINMGESGGIVFAVDKISAKDKVKKYYENRFDFDKDDEIVVWQWEEDEFCDLNNPDVIDCYGC